MKTITINGQDYTASLDVKAIIRLEDKMNTNPVNAIMTPTLNDNMPKTKDLILIFKESLVKMNHGINDDKAIELYQQYLSEGHTIRDFIVLVIDILRDAGLIPDEDEEEETDSKN